MLGETLVTVDRLGRRLINNTTETATFNSSHPERYQNGTESAQPENRMERGLPDRSIPVAQRTGAERFLASSAKSAGAGVCLALAVAALAARGLRGRLLRRSASSSGSTATSAAARQRVRRRPPGAAGAGRAKAGGSGGLGNLPQGRPRATGRQGKARPLRRQPGKRSTAPASPSPKAPPSRPPPPPKWPGPPSPTSACRAPRSLASAGQPAPSPPPYTCDGEGNWPAAELGGRAGREPPNWCSTR